VLGGWCIAFSPQPFKPSLYGFLHNVHFFLANLILLGKLFFLNQLPSPLRFSRSIFDEIQLCDVSPAFSDVHCMSWLVAVCLQLDLQKMPLGKLSKKQMQTAYSVLSKANEVMTSLRFESTNLRFVGRSAMKQWIAVVVCECNARFLLVRLNVRFPTTVRFRVMLLEQENQHEKASAARCGHICHPEKRQMLSMSSVASDSWRKAFFCSQFASATRCVCSLCPCVWRRTHARMSKCTRKCVLHTFACVHAPENVCFTHFRICKCTRKCVFYTLSHMQMHKEMCVLHTFACADVQGNVCFTHFRMCKYTRKCVFCTLSHVQIHKEMCVLHTFACVNAHGNVCFAHFLMCKCTRKCVFYTLSHVQMH